MRGSMTADELLGQLEAVRARGLGKWQARCPAHDDREPSLSIREADDGKILLHCFSGCTVDSICSAIGIQVTDLFPNSDPDPHAWWEAQRLREGQRRQREAQEYVDGLTIDARREAERLILSMRDIDISTWPYHKLDAVLNDLADAYDVLEGESENVTV